MRWLVLILALFAAQPAVAAEKVVAGLSQSHVSITTDFSGSEIFIYGAVKRTAPPPSEDPPDVIVVVIGPSEPVIVRKKDRKFGIWVNGPGIKLQAAPSFYAVASTGPFDEVISFTDDLRYKVGLTHAVRLIGDTQAERYPAEYREAAIRLRQAQGVYFEDPGGVTVTENTLFQTSVALPAQLIEGDYTARVFLLRDKEVVDYFESTIAVRKVGLERMIYTMAQEQGALYGLISIFVALAAGWLASAFFRLMFP